jgi:uncharacterized protein (DUF1778 family)
MKKFGHLKGRPAMAEGRRTKKVDARFTEDEYKLIQEMEKQLGIRKTDLVRSRVLQNASNIIINAKELIIQLDNIGSELGKSGNNINQLAKYANTLQRKNIASPIVMERFNALFQTYLSNQAQLDVALRQIIRAVHNQ